MKLIRKFGLTCVIACVAVVTSVRAAQNEGIVSSVTKAPVSPDGLVSGRATEMVIHFDVSLDPKVPGRTLLKDKTIKITLPDDFVPDGRPIKQAGTCSFLTDCNSAVLLQGWPQNPIAPPKYALSYEGTHTIVFTAKADLVPVSELAPGIKQAHLIIRGFTNPRPGHYPILVEAETGPGGALETGIGDVHIIPQPRPNLNVTSVFGNPPPRRSKLYQETHPGELIPLSMDFLLWDRSAEPFLGVEIVALRGGNSDALLVQGKRTVGHVMVDIPAGAVGQDVFTTEPSKLVNSPVTGFPTALLQAWFRAGSATGEYVLTFSLTGGNSVEMHVLVN